jgi:hypothetical protein
MKPIVYGLLATKRSLLRPLLATKTRGGSDELTACCSMSAYGTENYTSGGGGGGIRGMGYKTRKIKSDVPSLSRPATRSHWPRSERLSD